MKFTLKSLVLAFTLGLSTLTATAGMFGTDITIPDGNYNSRSWEGNYEDQETEPRTIHSQAWDLEGMFLDGTKLTVVGGYDFKRGLDGTRAGDLWVGTKPGTNWGYDFVYDLNFSNLTFDLFSTFTCDFSYTNSKDIPSSGHSYRNSGGTLVQSGTFSYLTGLTDTQTGFLGGKHNAFTLDVSYFRDNDAIFKNTMSCGNDLLVGYGTPVPDAATTLSLFGVALMGLAGFRKFTA
jgi:hypothetical protein